MRRQLPWLACGLCLALAVAPAMVFAQAEPAPDEITGIDVGEEAPDFTLEGHDDKEYTLSDLTEKGPVALVFYRSANW